ncbi:hypothetical protein MIND_01243300 [Mycena indigotica]|uniref:DDE Tnp4 domain-containing protein n=1 Tax=Mycena indigotica TaxID=2126181 RepID=A0A8H6S499_9AGAR|nr:uncharacterized protein MIND_01243300 [Mycena indigotica]KAF7292162.1 hypothetical protein MIND_01243300 [Mycena indigotica]
MERLILQSSIGFYSLLQDVLEQQDQEWIAREGRFRPGGRISLDDLGDDIWVEQFRFRRHEIYLLSDILDLPPVIVCSQSRVKEDSASALCMLLCRLVHVSRLVDVEMQFGWERSRFSHHSDNSFINLEPLEAPLALDPHRLTPEKLTYFATVMQQRGAPLDCRLVFNGWKRIHCLKYHSLITPDGIVIHIYGPVEGRRHDETVYQQSGLSALLEKHFVKPDGSPLFIYGDPAYTVAGRVLAGYKGAALSPEQIQFNTLMSRCREPVEWSFKEVVQQFPFLDFSRNHKVLLSPCGLWYLVAILLGNAHTILHHPQIPQYFQCPPPTLEEYFTGGPVDDAELDAWCLDSPWVQRDEQQDDTDSDSDV